MSTPRKIMPRIGMSQEGTQGYGRREAQIVTAMITTMRIAKIVIPMMLYMRRRPRQRKQRNSRRTGDPINNSGAQSKGNIHR